MFSELPNEPLGMTTVWVCEKLTNCFLCLARLDCRAAPSGKIPKAVRKVKISALHNN